MAPNENTEDALVSASIKQMFFDLLQEKGITVSNVDIKAGSIKGDNYLGVIAKAEVTGKDKEGKEINNSYIIKSAPRSEGLRKFAPIHIAYEREIFVYSTVLPYFEKFQTERNIKNRFTSFAQYLASSFEHKEEALIMTDMKAQGYSMQNRKQPLDYNHVRLVINELARYHALSFASRDQDPEVFAELSKNMETNYFGEMEKGNLEKMADEQCTKAQNTLNPETDQEIIEKFKVFQKNYADCLTSLIDDHCHPYSVLRHGDCWTNNFLFAYRDKTNPKVPTNLCFLDWQISMVGPPVLDLLYFIYLTTDQDLRDKHYYSLLKDYYQTLTEFTKELGTDLEKHYSFDIMMKQMKKYGKYGLAMAIMILQLLLSDSDDIPDFNEILDTGMDEDQMMEAFKVDLKNVDVYNKRIRDIILHCYELGFI